MTAIKKWSPTGKYDPNRYPEWALSGGDIPAGIHEDILKILPRIDSEALNKIKIVTHQFAERWYSLWEERQLYEDARDEKITRLKKAKEASVEVINGVELKERVLPEPPIDMVSELVEVHDTVQKLRSLLCGYENVCHPYTLKQIGDEVHRHGGSLADLCTSLSTLCAVMESGQIDQRIQNRLDKKKGRPAGLTDKPSRCFVAEIGTILSDFTEETPSISLMGRMIAALTTNEITLSGHIRQWRKRITY
jgi:hypothetical protein